MPTYSYECGGCGLVVDLFHGMSAEPKVKCEECGKKCKRLIGTGSGIIFKGSGFYETDFKEKKGTNPDKAAPEKKSEGTSEGKAEGKTEGKTESKPEGASEKKSKTDKPNDAAKKKAANN